jgi:L-threonylcarbamoyladenylate synthase
VESIKINLEKITKQEIGLIAGFLKKGKVIVYPTDTIYGLGCLASEKKAINKVYRIKKREKKKPLLVLISDFKMLSGYFLVDKKQTAYLRKVWPGMISVILNKKKLLSNELSAGLSSVAVRLPKSRFLTKMIKEAGGPIVSTSLNLSGEKPVEIVDNLSKYFKGAKPDFVVDAGILDGKPSKLIDLRDVENIKVLRN